MRGTWGIFQAHCLDLAPGTSPCVFPWDGDCPSWISLISKLVTMMALARSVCMLLFHSLAENLVLDCRATILQRCARVAQGVTWVVQWVHKGLDH